MTLLSHDQLASDKIIFQERALTFMCIYAAYVCRGPRNTHTILSSPAVLAHEVLAQPHRQGAGCEDLARAQRVPAVVHQRVDGGPQLVGLVEQQGCLLCGGVPSRRAGGTLPHVRKKTSSGWVGCNISSVSLQRFGTASVQVQSGRFARSLDGR